VSQGVSNRLLRMIASRVRDEVDSSSLGQTRKPGSELGHNNTNLKTVAVLPVSRNVPIEAFARKLQAALEGMGASTSYLNQTIITKHLGKHAFTRMGKLKVRNLSLFVFISYLTIQFIQSAGWLTDQEQRFHLVLYVVDSPVSSPWTQTCIRQVR
jgi:lysophospholipid hydrolase